MKNLNPIKVGIILGAVAIPSLACNVNGWYASPTATPTPNNTRPSYDLTLPYTIILGLDNYEQIRELSQILKCNLSSSLESQVLDDDFRKENSNRAGLLDPFGPVGKEIYPPEVNVPYYNCR